MSKYDTLNTMQKEAVFHTEGPLLLLAGAGSGKTAVLTERVIRKIRSGVDVNKLLVLTFTNEAANEMKNRIACKIIVTQASETSGSTVKIVK